MLLDAQNNCLATLQLRLLSMLENAFRVQHKASSGRSPPCYYLLFLCWVSSPVLSSRNFAALGMVQHVVDYSYSPLNHSRLKAIEIALRASLSGLKSLSFPLAVFFL